MFDHAEFRKMLSEEADPKNAIVTINAGAGGTESQDWAQMLLRMYQRWGQDKGFKVELLYSVPKAKQGSWVSMTPDPKGRLVVSDQYGSLYRVTPGNTSAETAVEKLNVPIGQAQGLLDET